MTNEIRTGTMGLECRAGQFRIGGYALQYNSLSRPLGRFVEKIAPSFIERAKQQAYRGVISRYSHRDEYLLGSVDNRTLTLSDDQRGLQYTVEVPGFHGWVYDSVKRGDLRSLSFAFNEAEDDWTFEDGMPIRTLLDGNLYEVGPCPIGAYESADVGLRSLAAKMDADPNEVMTMSDRDELRKLFTRSDSKPLSGRLALLDTMKMAQSEQDRRTTLSGSQAMYALTMMAHKEY